MNNFLKSECYKVSHRAYPYTLLIIGVVIAILINVSVWYAIHVIRIPFTIEGADIMNAGLYMMATIVWYCIIFTTDIGGENNAVPDDRCHHIQTGIHNICTFDRKWDPDDMDGIPDRYVDQNGNDHSDNEQGIWISPMAYFVTFTFEEIIQSLSLLTVQ